MSNIFFPSLSLYLSLSGNYICHLLQQSIALHYAFMNFIPFSLKTGVISSNSINQLSVLIMKCGVFFEVRTELSDIICMNFGFKGLMKQQPASVMMSVNGRGFSDPHSPQGLDPINRLPSRQEA
jgi:hypothetical protein